MKSAELKKTLERFDKKELIQLITELAKLKKYNMEWLEIEFQRPDELPELLEYYKKKISRALDSNDFTAANKAISDFKKASPDREKLIDLMIYYVEQGTEITLDCGDMYEDFYTKLENVYIDAIKLLNEWGDTKLIEKFRPRMETLINKTEDVGWGYHDVLWDWYDELGISEKEE
ncbi:MAG TPA: hypothetical protein VJJ51_00085 [Candidatus Methanoperedens sp.]|nr:hypothetical protein [Candidatus Methanoperedens sp.]HLB69421.1 hypothetical protein [Candidatus Methanoperedens sp.]